MHTAISLHDHREQSALRGQARQSLPSRNVGGKRQSITSRTWCLSNVGVASLRGARSLGAEAAKRQQENDEGPASTACTTSRQRGLAGAPAGPGVRPATVRFWTANFYLCRWPAPEFPPMTST